MRRNWSYAAKEYGLQKSLLNIDSAMERTVRNITARGSNHGCKKQKHCRNKSAHGKCSVGVF